MPSLFQRSLKFLFIHFFFLFERDLFLPPLPYILFGSEILPTNGSFVRGGDPTSPPLTYLFTVISAPPPTQRRLCRAQFHRRGLSVKYFTVALFCMAKKFRPLLTESHFLHFSFWCAFVWNIALRPIDSFYMTWPKKINFFFLPKGSDDRKVPFPPVSEW